MAKTRCTAAALLIAIMLALLERPGKQSPALQISSFMDGSSSSPTAHFSVPLPENLPKKRLGGRRCTLLRARNATGVAWRGDHTITSCRPMVAMCYDALDAARTMAVQFYPRK